jgi:hypothetical protein
MKGKLTLGVKGSSHDGHGDGSDGNNMADAGATLVHDSNYNVVRK